jgi:signal transduction histidine kinase
MVGSSPSRDELKAASREVDALISEYIKPLSKSRWRDGELIWVKAGFLSIMKRTLEVKRIPVVAIVLLTFPFAVVSQTNRIGFLGTLYVQSIWISITIIINQIIFRSTPEKNYLTQNQRFLALTLLVTYPVTFIAQYNLMGAGSESLTLMFEGYLISIVAEICIFLIGTLLVSLYDDQEFVFSFLRELIKKGELEQLLDRTRSGNADADFAQYLHAEVQSQLLACKLLLLKAAESDFDLFPLEITQQIIERMEKISQPYEKPAARIPAVRIEELSASWYGLAKIRHKLPSELAELHHYSDIASQLIEEAVVNSIRHGGAKEIFISAKFIGSILEVEITDNGILLEGSGARGLGSILFDTFTTSWSRSRVGNSTIMKFDLDTIHKETLR